MRSGTHGSSAAAGVFGKRQERLPTSLSRLANFAAPLFALELPQTVNIRNPARSSALPSIHKGKSEIKSSFVPPSNSK